MFAIDMKFWQTQAEISPSFNLNFIYTECGTDNVCTFDLSLEIGDSIQSPFVIGSSQWITLTINVKNNAGDPAYLPLLKIPFPRELEISKLPKGCDILVGYMLLHPDPN